MSERQVSASSPLNVGRSGLWFLAVGVAASLTHMAVFAALRPVAPPEWANVGGFLIAFGLSFFGHRLLSFADTRISPWQSLARFVPTALLGFACNEGTFVALIKIFHWPEWLALLTAMALAAALTFVLGRYWAFKR